MDKFRSDLHCHTTYSDGTFTPKELIAHAKQRGLSGLSITDHDTISAYHEAIPEAESQGILLVPGVEFSSMHKGVSIHILGYAFPVASPLIEKFCHMHIKRRTDRNRAILDNVRAKLNLHISEEDLAMGSKPGTLGRPHIAQAMVVRGLAHSIQDAFARFLAEGQCCYEPGESISVEETLQCLHDAKGKAVIAHPHLIDEPNIIHELGDMPFDGIEAYYARFTEPQVKRWKKMAERKGWFITGGSDFHGDVKPMNPLGSSWAPFESFMALYNHYQSQCTTV